MEIFPENERTKSVRWLMMSDLLLLFALPRLKKPFHFQFCLHFRLSLFNALKETEPCIH